VEDRVEAPETQRFPVRETDLFVSGLTPDTSPEGLKNNTIEVRRSYSPTYKKVT
jgi:hypothetical protein